MTIGQIVLEGRRLSCHEEVTRADVIITPGWPELHTPASISPPFLTIEEIQNQSFISTLNRKDSLVLIFSIFF